jgi:hypothetical protein
MNIQRPRSPTPHMPAGMGTPGSSTDGIPDSDDYDSSSGREEISSSYHTKIRIWKMEDVRNELRSHWDIEESATESSEEEEIDVEEDGESSEEKDHLVKPHFLLKLILTGQY